MRVIGVAYNSFLAAWGTCRIEAFQQALACSRHSVHCTLQIMLCLTDLSAIQPQISRLKVMVVFPTSCTAMIIFLAGEQQSSLAALNVTNQVIPP